MLDFVYQFFNFIAGVWTVVFKDTILTLGSLNVSLGDIVIAGMITVMCVNLFWRGAKV